MEWVLIIALAGALALLWRRVAGLERRIEDLGEMQDEVLSHLRMYANQAPAAEPHAARPDDEPDAASPSGEAAHDASFAAGSLDAAPEDTPAAPYPAGDEPGERASGLRLPAFDLEDVFGRRLPIWAGGMALAIAGVFLVRYSIERGLITPLLRVALAFAFGAGLLGAAEAAYRWRDRIADPRVAQALAGAGLATLYAGFYLAGTQYGLIGQGLAFLGLAMVTAGAIGLSFRFGLPSAVLGLLGGFAAPVLVGGGEPNVPLLALYLALVTAGLTFSGRRQDRPWLGASALVGGLAWGAVLLAGEDFAAIDLLSLGVFLLVLGAVIPAMIGSARFERLFRLAAAVAASIELAVLVTQGGFTPLVWGLYLLLGIATVWFGWTRADLREANLCGAAIGLGLFAAWPQPPAGLALVVGGALALLFSGVPVAAMQRATDRRIDRVLAGTVPAILAILAYAKFADLFGDRAEWALAAVTLVLAAFPALGARMLWNGNRPRSIAALVGSAAALAFAALLLVTPGWAAPLSAAAVACVPLGLLRGRRDADLAATCWAAMLVAVLALVATPHGWEEIARLFGQSSDIPQWRALLRWAALFVPALGLALWSQRPYDRRAAEGLAVVIAYGALAQVVLTTLLPGIAALAAVGLWMRLPERRGAAATAAAISLAWAAAPFVTWFAASTLSLGGVPVFVSALPQWMAAVTRILPAAIAIALVPVIVMPAGAARFDSRMVAAPLALALVQILYKQVFAIDGWPEFRALGLAERTVWEAGLVGLGWLVSLRWAHTPQRALAGQLLVLSGLGHFLVFTLLLHNPLWSEQAVGQFVILNLAAASYAVALGAALVLRKATDGRRRVALDGITMLLASFAAMTLLRQACSGTMLQATAITQGEDLVRSMLGILLALFFLWVGIRRGERSWRVGSLVMMLVAVAKVFLFDAAGLEGLLRIASFMALGFSLIGIGWIYSRQLKAGP